MKRIVIVLDKYSDWLESYSVLDSSSNFHVLVFIVRNDRNDYNSINSVFDFISKRNNHTYEVKVIDEKMELFKVISSFTSNLEEGEMIVAPFIRYRHLWDLVPKFGSNVLKIHLSECLPDTFGHIGYRLGFRGKKLKTWLMLPISKVYSLLHKPDICYFPLNKFFKNPFVVKTLPVSLPTIIPHKKDILLQITSGAKRPLLIGGFGYDVFKMAKALNIKKYIATSKGSEIIVDGKVIPLEERICAEEVLLCGLVESIIGYTSSVIVWAKLYDPSIPIECYEAKEFGRKYGFLYNFFARKRLRKLGVIVKDERIDMLY